MYGMREAVAEGPGYWVSGVGASNELAWELISGGCFVFGTGVRVDIVVGDRIDRFILPYLWLLTSGCCTLGGGHGLGMMRNLQFTWYDFAITLYYP